MAKVTVYSTPTCPWCVRAEEFLKKNNVEFNHVDVSKDHEAAQQMVEKSGQMGVPVIEIDDKVIVGFDEAAIRAELGL